MHCLACHGWLDYCLRLDELSANMYISACCSRSSRLLEVHVAAESLDTVKAKRKDSPKHDQEKDTEKDSFFKLNFGP